MAFQTLPLLDIVVLRRADIVAGSRATGLQWLAVFPLPLGLIFVGFFLSAWFLIATG
jgi:hypothetical protein